MLLSVVLLICLPANLAIDTTTYASGWNEFISTVSSQGETFEVYGQNDLVTSSSDTIDGTLSFYHNNQSTLVHFDDCATKGSFEFCFLNASFSHEKITSGEGIGIYPAVQYSIKGTDYSPYVHLTLTSQKKQLAPGQKATIALRLFNNHTSSLKNIILTVDIPNTIQLKNSKLFTLLSQNDDVQTYALELPSIRPQKEQVYSLDLYAQEELTEDMVLDMGSETIQASLLADVDTYKDLSFQTNLDLPVINPYTMISCTLACPQETIIDEEIFCNFSIQKQSDKTYKLENVHINSELSTQTISLDEDFIIDDESYVLHSFPLTFSQTNYVNSSDEVNDSQAQELNLKEIIVSLNYTTPLNEYTCLAQEEIQLKKKSSVIDELQESDEENPNFGKDAKEKQRTQEDNEEGFFEKLVRLIKSVF